ncbi:hypothetical protein KY339_05545 [Candidatus Woesearchaeota archaeon]|nr:hypothetical protein [Candidatus Woesearchaeota archaeon]
MKLSSIDIRHTLDNRHRNSHIYSHLEKYVEPIVPGCTEQITVAYSDLSEPNFSGTQALTFPRIILINTEESSPESETGKIAAVHEFFHIYIADMIPKALLATEFGKKAFQYVDEYCSGSYNPTLSLEEIKHANKKYWDSIKRDVLPNSTTELRRVPTPNIEEEVLKFFKKKMEGKDFMSAKLGLTAEGDRVLTLMEVGCEINYHLTYFKLLEEGLVTYLTARATGMSIDKIREIIEPNKESEYFYTNAREIEDEFGNDIGKVLDLIEKGKKEFAPFKYVLPMFPQIMPMLPEFKI